MAATGRGGPPPTRTPRQSPGPGRLDGCSLLSNGQGDAGPSHQTTRDPGPRDAARPEDRTVVLALDGLQWATQKAAVEAVLGRRRVVGVAANPVGQTATVTFEPALTSTHEAG